MRGAIPLALAGRPKAALGAMIGGAPGALIGNSSDLAAKRKRAAVVAPRTAPIDTRIA